ncbi:hypothetical protein BGZ46_005876, partial [Entomortierella lignicola]
PAVSSEGSNLRKQTFGFLDGLLLCLLLQPIDDAVSRAVSSDIVFPHNAVFVALDEKHSSAIRPGCEFDPVHFEVRALNIGIPEDANVHQRLFVIFILRKYGFEVFDGGAGPSNDIAKNVNVDFSAC